jgi:hypothetical protein
MTAGDMDADVLQSDDVIVELRARRGTSRYTRQSGALPRLADDPDYIPMSGGLPHPVSESHSFLSRLRDRLNGR